MCTACSLTVSHRILRMPPQATTHAPPEQPCMPPQSNHARPPQEQPRTPPGATMHAPLPEQPQGPPPVNRITDACENITFANYVCGR